MYSTVLLYRLNTQAWKRILANKKATNQTFFYLTLEVLIIRSGVVHTDKVSIFLFFWDLGAKKHCQYQISLGSKMLVCLILSKLSIIIYYQLTFPYKYRYWGVVVHFIRVDWQQISLALAELLLISLIQFRCIFRNRNNNHRHLIIIIIIFTIIIIINNIIII